ncbi:MAG: 4-(cytidine 5'-diphospho)-2-C-methyl-D-erythritol kinase [Candidatus Omnitrophica bacterium]|nr:4-(cytidine 5'-diphospho)-2-C-methyl-D-erythritol kinase [Candidatus Omnitrophota bacterium]
MLKLLSPAKLNLTLKILGKRPDGFHELETLFERIDLVDEITFKPAPEGIHISCDHPDVPCDERNLVFKGARLLQEGEHVTHGARIHIKKRIPVAAGLAGGSSNGATAIRGLDQLWGLKLSRAKRVAYAKKLGSDVAFFLYDTPWAVGLGRGEKIKPVTIKPQYWHVLITPSVPVLTKDVYGHYAGTHKAQIRPKRGGDFGLTKLSDDVIILIRSLRKMDFYGVGKGLSNDLSPSMLALRPRLAELQQKLQKQDVRGVSFSGSGPSIFAITETRAQAERVKKVFALVYSQVFIVQTL